MSSPLIKITDLQKTFSLKHELIFALREVNLSIDSGKTLGLVGESGCGKSTLAKILMQLERPSAGTVQFNGTDLFQLSWKELKSHRKNMQMIFQDPYSSLNPRMTVGDIIYEPIEIHQISHQESKEVMIEGLLEMVGLNHSFKERFPHQLSGGQRQRIGIARALALNPQCLICDEPISALDVSVQAQIINLFKKLQQEKGLSLLFIAHDLRVVRYISNDVAVMYLGEIVEYGEADGLYSHPRHPYTQALLNSIPIPDPKLERSRKLSIIPNEISLQSFTGCSFAPRCPIAQSICHTKKPVLQKIGLTHQVACHFPL